MSSDQNPGYLVYIGDEILPTYTGIVISYYKDPQKPIGIMECHKGFDCIWSNYAATSHGSLTPNGGLVREIPLFQGNLGW